MLVLDKVSFHYLSQTEEPPVLSCSSLCLQNILKYTQLLWRVFRLTNSSTLEVISCGAGGPAV